MNAPAVPSATFVKSGVTPSRSPNAALPINGLMRSRLAQWSSGAEDVSAARVDLRWETQAGGFRKVQSEPERLGETCEIKSSPAAGEIPLGRIKSLQSALQALPKMPTLLELQRGLAKLFMEVQWFTGFGQAHLFEPLRQLGACLELYLADLHHCEVVMDVSAYRTLAQAVDFITKMSLASPKLRLSNRRCRVLVAVGAPGACHDLVAALEKVGIETTVSASHETCLRWAAQNPLDLAIVNLEVQTVEGWELCSALRQLAKSTTLSVIPINAPTGDEHRAFAAAHECHDWLAGIVSTSELRLRLITHVFGKRLPDATTMIEAHSRF